MKTRYCPDCGTKLQRTTTRAGIPRDICPNCTDSNATFLEGP